MKRQPAVRCCGLSAFCAAVCTNESSRVGLDFQEELGELFGFLWADRVLEGAHVRPGLSTQLHVDERIEIFHGNVSNIFGVDVSDRSLHDQELPQDSGSCHSLQIILVP